MVEPRERNGQDADPGCQQDAADDDEDQDRVPFPAAAGGWRGVLLQCYQRAEQLAPLGHAEAREHFRFEHFIHDTEKASRLK